MSEYRKKKKGPVAPGEKPKDFKGTWSKLLKYCKNYRLMMGIAVVAVAVATVLTLLGPDRIAEMTRVITEGLVTGIDMEKVKSVGIVLIVFYVITFVLYKMFGSEREFSKKQVVTKLIALVIAGAFIVGSAFFVRSFTQACFTEILE